MTQLIIKGTVDTPEINFNPSSGVLKMSGRAYSSGINMFYRELDLWMDEYLSAPAELTSVEIRMDYCNSIYNKLLLLFFGKCKGVITKNKKLTICWYHHNDDPDAIDDIVRISGIIKFPIEPIRYS
jgi:hypothetical protein